MRGASINGQAAIDLVVQQPDFQIALINQGARASKNGSMAPKTTPSATLEEIRFGMVGAELGILAESDTAVCPIGAVTPEEFA